MLAYALLLTSVTPAQAIDDCVAAHRRLDAASIVIDATANAQGKQFHNRFTLSYQRPGTLLLRIRAGASRDQVASDRTFLIKGTKLVALQPATNEYLTRTIPDKKNSLAERAILILESVDDSVKFMLDPDALQKFLGTFRKLNGWTSQARKSGTVLTRSQAGKSNVRFEFGKDSLLRIARISAPGSLLSWRYEYGHKPSSLTLTIPRGSRKVESFLAVGGTRLKFSDKSASTIWDASTRAYGSLRSASILIRSGERSTRVLFSGHRSAQIETGLSWSYDGHLLSISRGGRFRRGAIAASDIPGVVGDQIEPFLRSWALHKNPARVLAGEEMSGRLAGSVKVGAVPCDLIEFQREGLKVSVLVRRKDHLFARVSSEGRDASSQRLSSLDREFTYSSINKPLPSSVFTLKPRSGQKIEKLP